MDEKILALLGLAEHFRLSNNIRKCIQCLEALLTIKTKAVQCRTHLQLGQVLVGYTTNKDLATSHLEQAWILSENLTGYDDVKFETASLLAQLYCKDQENPAKAKPILRKAVELSQHNIYWHSKLLFQIAQIHVSEKEYTLASDLLQIGVEAADAAEANYLKSLFMLSRAMILIIERKTNNVPTLLKEVETIIESIQNVHLKEYLRVFLLILQVCHYLQLGNIKSVKVILKQLQQSIQTIIATNWPSDEQIFGQNQTESFMWLPKEQMYVLVYLVTVSHSMMAGYMEKAQKYTEKALTQIEKLKSQENKPILALFQIFMLEHIIMCRLVMGNRSLAIKEIAAAKDVCLSTPNKFLLKGHSAQLHCLLGLYAMSANLFTEAEAQFHTCVSEATHKELKLFANLNLAIVYLRTQKANELKQLLDHIGNDNSQSFTNQAMLGSYYYVQGLNAFHKNGFQEAKRFLRESLKMANAEDLNRLTSCSLVLLSHVFLSIGNSKESMNMVTPAMQLASKIPDVHVQLWGSAILRDLHNMLNRPVAAKEAYDCYLQFSQNLLNDQYTCSTLPEHSLINWLSGLPPPPLQ